VLIGRQGALCGNINYALGQFWASEHAVVASPLEQFNTLWFGELLRIMNLNQYSISAAQPGLSVERIQNLKLPVPPLGEQDLVASFVGSEITRIVLAITHAKREIDLIREYRTRLIADVVTGKLDVRDVELPPEQDMAPEEPDDEALEEWADEPVDWQEEVDAAD
jgi:type I restriction enzyme, S subunit